MKIEKLTDVVRLLKEMGANCVTMEMEYNAMRELEHDFHMHGYEVCLHSTSHRHGFTVQVLGVRVSFKPSHCHPDRVEPRRRPRWE